MRSKLSVAIDTAVLFLVVGILVFAWVRFYTREVLISALVGATLAGLVCYLVVFLGSKRANKLRLTKQEQGQISALSTNLRFTSNDDILAFLTKVLTNSHSVSNCADFLIIEPNSSQNQVHSTLHSTSKNSNSSPTHEQTSTQQSAKKLFDSDDEILLAPYFTKPKIDSVYLAYVIKCANKLDLRHVALLGLGFEDEVISFSKQIRNIKIELVPIENFYHDYLAGTEITLPCAVDISRPKLKYRELLSYAFSPARARHYLLFGLLIILMSFLVPFKIYYLISGSILCIVALIVRVAPLLKKQN